MYTTTNTPMREPAVPQKAPPPPCPAQCNRAADPAERVAMIQQELAEAEGLKGAELTKRMDELVADHNSSAWDNALLLPCGSPRMLLRIRTN